MVKDSGRKCSRCGIIGHNSRTCLVKGHSFKLFGASIPTPKQEDESIRKSKSTGNLITCHAEHSTAAETGYISDCFIYSEKAKAPHESTTKRGFPWTEAEHECFLDGLEELGKGDWKGISRKYIPSRTPTQIASHAQKYYLRVAVTGEKKKKQRRRSLFDTPIKELLDSSTPVSTISQQDSSPPVSTVLPSNTVPGMSQQVEVPSNMSIPAANGISTISFVPVNNFFYNQGHVYFHTNDGNFGNCAPSWAQLLPQLFPVGPSQTEGATSRTNFDGLDLSL